jgi:mono/diheme cytochrome c family protein
MQALLLALIWVAAALIILFVAMFRSRDVDAPSKRRGALPGGAKILIALAAALLVLGVPAAVLSKTTDRMPNGAGEYTIDASARQIDGRTIFRSTCASCHTLSAANARGVYGPDLDKSLGAPGSDPKATVARVEGAIKTGGATGKQMPLDLLSGEDARLVSEYIAAVAGK